jgi:hypothetical protein
MTDAAKAEPVGARGGRGGSMRVCAHEGVTMKMDAINSAGTLIGRVLDSSGSRIVVTLSWKRKERRSWIVIVD